LQHQLSQYIAKLLHSGYQSDQAKVERILAICLSKELIWTKSIESQQRETLRQKAGGIQLSFEFGSSKQAAKIDQIKEPIQENILLKKVLSSLSSAVKRDIEKKADCLETLW